MIVHAVSNPESFISTQIAHLKTSGEVSRCFALEYVWRQYYLPSQPEIALIALVAVSNHGLHVALVAPQPYLVTAAEMGQRQLGNVSGTQRE